VVAKDSPVTVLPRILNHHVPGAGFCPLGTKVSFASKRQAGAKSRETCVCSASVSARHSASLTTSLALMIDTSIAEAVSAHVQRGWNGQSASQA
jgi:hypothetical protein